MLTDQEFLNGIYSKAEALKQEETKRKSRKSIAPPLGSRLAIAAALCILAFFLLPASFRLLSLNSPPSASTALEEPNPASELRSAPMMALMPVLLEGTVTEAQEEDGLWTVSLMVNQVFQGEKMETVTFTCEADRGFRFNLGETGLFYLEEASGSFLLANGDYGKYEFIGEEEGERVYRASDGSTITSGLLKQ